MAKDCGCSGATCGCLIVAGAGITITGIGTASNPFVVTRDSSTDSIGGQLQVDSSPTIDMTLLGTGTIADPLIVKAALSATALDGTVGTDGSVLDVVKLSQAEYDVLTPVPTTIYFIV